MSIYQSLCFREAFCWLNLQHDEVHTYTTNTYFDGGSCLVTELLVLIIHRLCAPTLLQNKIREANKIF